MSSPLSGIRHEQNPSVRIQQAIQEMRRRGVIDDRCPRCKHTDWKVDIVNIPASSEVGWKSLPPLTGNYVYSPTPTGYVSLLSIVCTTCGYTMFHDIAVLGV
jgi:predicted nucleic-acid-binding Zn-ribbon protein